MKNIKINLENITEEQLQVLTIIKTYQDKSFNFGDMTDYLIECIEKVLLDSMKVNVQDE